MKTKYYFIAALSYIAIFITSCSESWPYSEDAYNKIWINVSPSYIFLDEDELSGEFTVESTDRWYVYDSPSWVNMSSLYGYGYDNVSFTVDENDGSSTRYGHIKIRTDEGFTKEAEIEVAQSPTVQFEASMSRTNYSASGDYWYLTVNAASSRSWTISKSDSWVHLGSSSSTSYSYSGKGKELVAIHVDSNPYSSKRSSVLTVKCGSKSKTITITQDGKTNYVPFVITSVDVANVTYEGSFINNYGSRIYSYQTRYLKPKLYINVKTSGKYTVYTKLYMPNGSLSTGTSSPTGYSYSNTLTLYSWTTSWELSGWGSNTAGCWSAGKYRWEFWYNGEKIGEKSFTIY